MLTFLHTILEDILVHYRFCTKDQIDLNLFTCPMNLVMFFSFVLQTWHLLCSPPAWIDFAVQEKQGETQQYPLLLTSDASFFFSPPFVAVLLVCSAIESNLSSLSYISKNSSFWLNTLCQNYLPSKAVNCIRLVFLAVFACIDKIQSEKCYKTKTYFQHFRKLFGWYIGNISAGEDPKWFHLSRELVSYVNNSNTRLIHHIMVVNLEHLCWWKWLLIVPKWLLHVLLHADLFSSSKKGKI